MKIQILYILALVGIVFTSCQPEETPADLIGGRWDISSNYILGTTVDGDGSYLTFSGGSDGSGTDYKASDATTGAFTYTMNEAGTVVTIVDNDSDGGSYNGSWDILELTDSRFRITTDTFLGTLQVTMEK